MIRKGTINDLDLIAELEAACFPPLQAASKEKLKKRLEIYPECFWLLFENDELISYIDGFKSSKETLVDEMYDDPTRHEANAAWQMIFGVCTRPSHEHQGYASKLMEEVIKECKEKSLKGLILTCKEEKITFYEKFGYVNEGVSSSEHGGVVWYQMKLTF